jgi:hypothetical protein
VEDDLISSLTRQVKEDVIENYLRERKLAFLQIESLQWQAGMARACAGTAARCLTRLAYLTIHPEMAAKLSDALCVPAGSHWSRCLEQGLPGKLQLIRVRGLTEKSKFRKLVLESYVRLDAWMEKYRKAYEDLQTECRAVNRNIIAFQNNFDLLAILGFLRNLDTVTLEKKLVMGENFTAEELASLDQKLYIRPMTFEELNVPAPLLLPKTGEIERLLSDLADEIYRKHPSEVRRVMR